MNPNSTIVPMTIGTIGGTLSSFIGAIQYANLTETIMLSAVGAIISFLVSAFLDWTVKKIKQR